MVLGEPRLVYRGFAVLELFFCVYVCVAGLCEIDVSGAYVVVFGVA